MTYGCHNRAPFHAYYHVQDGYNPMSSENAGTRTPKIVKQPSFAAGAECQYTKTQLGQTDPKCVGCKWRAAPCAA